MDQEPPMQNQVNIEDIEEIGMVENLIIKKKI